MKIAIGNIPEEGLTLQFTKDGDWFRGFLDESAEKTFSLKNVEIACSIKKIHETLYLEGRVEGRFETACSRCLELALIAVQGDFRYTLMPAVSGFSEEKELSADELDVAYYEEETIDLAPLLFEQIMLLIPLKALCDDLCKGLCPRCGINLNEASCRCQTDHVDERLAVLKNFKIQKS